MSVSAALARPLEGKVALVTGGGSGIGRASALAFALAGAQVVVSDVDVAGGEETARSVITAGGEARFIRANVSRSAEVAALVGATVDAFGRLDCAHNNAGIEGDVTLLADYTEETWDQVIAVNLKGVWLCLKHEIVQMLTQGGGAIVNTASIDGLIGKARLAAYVASKHAVVGLTKSAALGYAQAGIRVNAVCPGYIDTPMLARHPDLKARAIEQTPVGRLGTAAEVAAAVIWLCSDAATFVTGHAMVVDGGAIA